MHEILFFYLQLEYRRKGDEKWNIVQPVVKDGKGNQFIVEHPIEALQPGSYEAVLKARNSFGWSVPSEPHMFNGGTYAVYLFMLNNKEIISVKTLFVLCIFSDYPPEMARKGTNILILSPNRQIGIFSLKTPHYLSR